TALFKIGSRALVEELLIIRLRQAGHNHDWDFGCFRAPAQLTQHLVSGQLGQHEIEYHQVWLMLKSQPQTFLAIGGFQHARSRLLQSPLIRQAQKPAVLYDQYIHLRIAPRTSKPSAMSGKTLWQRRPAEVPRLRLFCRLRVCKYGGKVELVGQR